MFGFAFAVVSPIILPVAWFFFLTAFLTYRYALLYVYERSYESGAWALGRGTVCSGRHKEGTPDPRAGALRCTSAWTLRWPRYCNRQ